MSTTAHAERDDVQALLGDLRRHAEEEEGRFEALLAEEARRQEAVGRWPFGGGWYRAAEIQTFRRRAWFRWLVVRLEALVLITLILLLSLALRIGLLQFLP